MKQKYQITVADMQLNIVSDAPRDEVENVVGILDRRMRDIHLKSPHCTKNEAAILCALSYCSERIAAQEAYQKMEKDTFRYAAENERLKKALEELKNELDSVRQDNQVMRSLLDRSVEQPSDVVSESKPNIESPVEAVAAMKEEPDLQASEEKSAKAKAKSRVGTMFDLLTFSDV